MNRTLAFEQALWDSGIERVAGVDEAGRGPLAGPVVAAAVVFAPGEFLKGVDDSKRVRPPMREILYERIRETALSVGVGVVDVETIDRINILQATYAAMRLALAGLNVMPGHVLVDGRAAIPDLAIPQTAVVRGDRKSFAVAAASIIAKVTRDRIMVEADAAFPEYGFRRHKGYGTRAHAEAIRRHGPCVLHRRTFRVPQW
jgi:ribonuclease HII